MRSAPGFGERVPPGAAAATVLALSVTMPVAGL